VQAYDAQTATANADQMFARPMARGLSWRLLYEICTRPSGPTKSFKPYGLTSKERVNGIRFSPSLVAILIENDNPAWDKKGEEIF
jgi:hypothetical protein